MFAPLLAVAALAACPQGDLAAIRTAHGAALLALSDECVERRLLNDAERILLLARAWDLDADELGTRTDALRAVRVKTVQEERDDYRAYLDSKDCVRARAWLEDAEEDLREETGDALCDLARGLLREGESRVAEDALELAFELDPESRDLRRVAGKDRLEELRRRRADERSLANLSLGETIVGPQVTLDDFEDKVVLWRSASL